MNEKLKKALKHTDLLPNCFFGKEKSKRKDLPTITPSDKNSLNVKTRGGLPRKKTKG